MLGTKIALTGFVFVLVSEGAEQVSQDLHLIHISWGGPERWLSCSGKHYVFEDHPYCGPIFLTAKTREPAENQPREGDRVWQHVNAWYQQGKRTMQVGDKVWCVYETQMQEARKAGAAARAQEPQP